MLIVEFVQTRDIAFPHPFERLPEPFWGRPLVALALMMVLLVFMSGRMGVARDRSSERSDRWLAFAAVLLFTIGCFTHFFAVSDEIAVNLEHAWNLFHAGRFSMSPTENVDGTIEVLFYLLHAPFARTLEGLVLANYVLALLFTVGCVGLVYRQFLRLPGALRHTWLFLLLAFPLIGTYGNGFGASFFCFGLLLAAGWALDGRTAKAGVAAALLPVLRPEAAVWSLALILFGPGADGEGTGWRARLRSRLPWLAALLCAVMLYYVAFLFAYGHWKPTPVLNKTLSLEGYRHLFDFGTFVHDQIELFLSGCGVLLLLPFVLLFRPSQAPSARKGLLLGGLAAALFYVVYYAVGSASMGWYGNQGFRYFAPALSFALLAFLVMARSLASPFRSASMVIALVLLPAPFVMRLAGESPVYTDPFVNRQWAARAGFVADLLVRDTDLKLATSEMNTFGLMIQDRPVEDYWSYTDRAVASSGLCSGDRVHWRMRDDAFPNKFDLFWVYFSSIYSADYFGSIEGRIPAFHHFAREGGYRLGDIPELMRDFDVLLLRLRTGETVTFMVRSTRGGEIAARLQQVGLVARRSREADLQTIREYWNRTQAKTVAC